MTRANAGVQGGFASLALGLAVPFIGLNSPAEAQSCTPPAFWNAFAPGGGRCEVYMCAEGWTLDNNLCRKSGEYPPYAASCPVGSGVTAVDWGGGLYEMRCVDPSPPPPPPSSRIRLEPAPPGTIRPADPSDVPVVSVRRVHTLPFAASESGSGEKSYEFSMDSATEVSVSLTGMNKDVDCRVNASSCTNYGGTRDDSWSGTLHAGTHTVTVYPYGGGSGNWTLSVSERRPTSVTSSPRPPQPTCPSGYTYVAAASRCERTQAFRMQAIETGISSQQSYSFTLRSTSTVSVSLTGLTRDFDCRVGSSYCTNNWGSADDSWSGTLGAGTHTVLVYPYGGGGPGDYTLTVAVNDVDLVSVVSPTGSGPEEIVCRKDGAVVDCPTPDEGISVVSTPIPVPRIEDPGPPRGPGQGDPGPEQTPDPGDEGGPPGGPTTPQGPTPEQKESTARADATARARNQTCREFFKDYGEPDIVGALAEVSFDDSDPRNVCRDGRAAYAEIGGANTIFTCDPFYGTTAGQRADTVLHEMLHIAGKTHDDLGGVGPFRRAVMNACP
ncbi:MAG: hypothetical protein F4X59_03120 [Holophagales bacterium]|nr:hypothetical protein [Holophagales bacterium]MYC09102.1 hypothetical protein [Holophagales bacterium]